MRILRYAAPVALLVVAVAVWTPVLGDREHDPVAVLTSGASRLRATTTITDGPVGAAGGDARINGLDPGLVAAYDHARAAASEAGHDLVINSGYRTPERQQQLLDEEVDKRGSYEEANRWVFTPEDSMHVKGLAIDVGDGGAADWLAEHGAAFGLCHTLEWEWWHFEWRERWEDAEACPPPAGDPSEAPGL